MGCQSPEQLQPIRALQNNTPHEKPEEWLPFLAQKIKHGNTAKDWWILNLQNTSWSMFNYDQRYQLQ